MKPFEFIYDHLLEGKKSLHEARVAKIPTQTAEIDDDDTEYQQTMQQMPALKTGKGASSIVAHKAGEVRQGTWNDNSTLKNSADETRVLQGFYTFPMVNDREHQIISGDNETSLDLLNNLYGVFDHPTPARIDQSLASMLEAKNDSMLVKAYKQYPVSAWIKGDQPRLQYVTQPNKEVAPTSINRIIRQVNAVVDETFKGKNIIKAPNGQTIWWANPEKLSKATTVALAHYIQLEPGLDVRTGEVPLDDPSWQHIIVGYLDNNGVQVKIQDLKKLVANFKVGVVEKLFDYRGVGGKADKRESGVDPVTVFGMQNEADCNSDERAIGKDFKGTTLTKPWTQLPGYINGNFASQPKKRDKLLEITTRTIGKTIASPINEGRGFPIEFTGITIKESGITPASVSVNFAEILHPIMCMKPGGVVDNGLLDAAETYLGTRDFSGCRIFYPGANAPLLDSIIIAPNNKQLMISSKKGAGMAPTITGLGAAYTALKASVAQTPNKQVQEQFKHYESLGYGKFAQFFETLTVRSGTKPEDLVNNLDGWTKKVGREFIEFRNAKTDSQRKELGDRIANRLNQKDFLDFCEFCISSTNLVQVNTEFTEDDKAGILSFDNFLATWPNAIADAIYFSYDAGTNTFKFKIQVGGKEISQVVAANPTGGGFDEVPGRAKSTTKKTTGRYAMSDKFAAARVPGSDTIQRWDWNDRKDTFKKKPSDGELTWVTTVKDLSRIYDALNENFPSKIEKKQRAIMYLKPLFDVALNFQREHGYDTSRGTGVSLPTNRLMAEINKLING